MQILFITRNKCYSTVEFMIYLYIYKFITKTNLILKNSIVALKKITSTIEKNTYLLLLLYLKEIHYSDLLLQEKNISLIYIIKNL
jgi:hypothetical protein